MNNHYIGSWFTLHWIDQTVQCSRASVTYNYVIFDTINHVFRSFSDVFIIWGVWRIMLRYCYIRVKYATKARPIPHIINGLACFLWALAFYQICLSFALSFAWLSFSDLRVIDEIAKVRSNFDIAFTTFQFLLTGGTGLVFWLVIENNFHQGAYVHVSELRDCHRTQRAIPEC